MIYLFDKFPSFLIRKFLINKLKEKLYGGKEEIKSENSMENENKNEPQFDGLKDPK